MSILSYSQNSSLPSKYIIKGDTCVVVSINQLKQANSKLLNRKYLINKNKLLSKRVVEIETIGLKKDSLISSLNLQISNYKTVEEKYYNIDTENKEKLYILQSDLERSQKNIKKVGIAGFAVGTLLTLILVR